MSSAVSLSEIESSFETPSESFDPSNASDYFEDGTQDDTDNESTGFSTVSNRRFHSPEVTSSSVNSSRTASSHFPSFSGANGNIETTEQMLEKLRDYPRNYFSLRSQLDNLRDDSDDDDFTFNSPIQVLNGALNTLEMYESSDDDNINDGPDRLPRLIFETLRRNCEPEILSDLEEAVQARLRSNELSRLPEISNSREFDSADDMSETFLNEERVDALIRAQNELQSELDNLEEINIFPKVEPARNSYESAFPVIDYREYTSQGLQDLNEEPYQVSDDMEYISNYAEEISRNSDRMEPSISDAEAEEIWRSSLRTSMQRNSHFPHQPASTQRRHRDNSPRNTDYTSRCRQVRVVRQPVTSTPLAEDRMVAVSKYVVEPKPTATDTNSGQSKEKDGGRPACIICFDKQVDAMLYPCNHFKYCYNCAQKLENCAECRSHIFQIIRPFMD